MFFWQQLFLVFTAVFSVVILVLSFIKSKNGQVFSETPWLLLLGIFVWGDGLVFSLFWVIIAAACLFFNDWLLFLLTVSVFWLIRSLGEVVYWLSEQFAVNHRNEPENLRGYAIVKNDAVYFFYQIFWQCVAVVSMIATIYFAVIWIKGML